ncbi:MAG: cytochrome C [Desulfuromonadales bacterium]|nr:cytochrome C [Desulfuromonadales bacterium]
MKKLLIALLAAAVFAAPALAADVVVFEAKNGNVTFDHAAHQKRAECAKCHQGTPAKFEVTKDWAHATCKGCHQEKSGPTKCNDCHKK